MSSEVASVVRTCVPLVVRHVDAATRAAVMEAVRPWVAVAEPKDAQDAQRLLRAGALRPRPASIRSSSGKATWRSYPFPMAGPTW